METKRLNPQDENSLPDMQMKDGKNVSGLDPIVQQLWRAFWLSINYCDPWWTQYVRLHDYFHGRRFKELQKTYSRVNIAYGYQVVADRMARMYQLFAGSYDKADVIGLDPNAALYEDEATDWLKHDMQNNANIDVEIIPVLQSVLFGGTAYRTVGIHMLRDYKGHWYPEVCGGTKEFFHILPCPQGGDVNPYDKYAGSAVPWVLEVDWMAENQIRQNGESGQKGWKADAIKKMLDGGPHKSFYLEEAWRDGMSVVGNLVWGSPQSWRILQDGIQDSSRRRRVIHWHMRDRHIIVGEDAFLIYDGPPTLKDGTIPVAKYTIAQDLATWFGIPYLGLLEDILKSSTMSFNYWSDLVLKRAFPMTYMPEDIQQHILSKGQDFKPAPNKTLTYPWNPNRKIQDEIWRDVYPEMPQDALQMDGLQKSIIQKISGLTETTGSLHDVVGNKTSGGVNAIMSELQARPNMESMVFEYTGFRAECMLKLKFAAEHYNERRHIRNADRPGKFATITPAALQQNYYVQTHGARYAAERDQNFQKLVTMLPLWNQSPFWDGYELNKAVAKSTGVLPGFERALRQQQEEPQQPGQQQQPGQPGGVASQQNITQQGASQGAASRLSRPRNNVTPGAQ